MLCWSAWPPLSVSPKTTPMPLVRVSNTSPATRQALLTALGLDITSEAGAQESLARLERLKNRPIPGCHPDRSPKNLRPSNSARSPGQLAWILIEEDGAVHEGRLAKDSSALDLPALPMGYHRLRLGDKETIVIAAPSRCWEPEALARRRKALGRDGPDLLAALGTGFRHRRLCRCGALRRST